MDKTQSDAIEDILEGQTPLAYNAHRLVAWKFQLEEGREPSVAELRVYLTEGRGTFPGMWVAMMKEFQHGRY